MYIYIYISLYISDSLRPKRYQEAVLSNMLGAFSGHLVAFGPALGTIVWGPSTCQPEGPQVRNCWGPTALDLEGGVLPEAEPLVVLFQKENALFQLRKILPLQKENVLLFKNQNVLLFQEWNVLWFQKQIVLWFQNQNASFKQQNPYEFGAPCEISAWYYHSSTRNFAAGMFGTKCQMPKVAFDGSLMSKNHEGSPPLMISNHQVKDHDSWWVLFIRECNPWWFLPRSLMMNNHQGSLGIHLGVTLGWLGDDFEVTWG